MTVPASGSVTTYRSLCKVTFVVVIVVTAIAYAPVFAGRIPFPAQIVFDYPPFASAAPAGYSASHANIGDLVHSFYPFRMLAARAVREGSLPLWNPFMLSGTPFLANAQSALFYPSNYLYYILPVPLAWTIGFFLRPLLAGLFTAVFLRKIGGTATGAVTSALLFAFCGFLIGWQGQAMSDAAVWLPFICYSVFRLHAEPSAPSAVIAACAFAMPVFAGHPETAIHLTLTGVAFALFLAVGKSVEYWNADIPFIRLFTTAGLIAFGLSAVQALPTMEWVAYAHRSFADLCPPLPSWAALAMVSRDVITETNSMGLRIPEYSAYLGMITFIAAPLAFLHSSRRLALFFALTGIIALSITYGVGPAFWLTRHLPVLSALKNERLVLVSTFSFVVLAGLGISALEGLETIGMTRRRFAVAILAGSGFAVSFAMIYMVHLYTKRIPELLRQPRASLALVCIAAVPVIWKLLGGITPRKFQVLVIAAAASDLCTFAYGTIPFVKAKDVFPEIELFERLKRGSESPFRIAQAGYAYGINFELVYGLSAVTGYDICLERIKRFLADVTTDEMPTVMFTTEGVLDKADRRIDLLNAKYYMISEYDPRRLEFRLHPERFRHVFSVGDTNVFENLKALPAAFMVPAAGIEVLENEEQQLTRVKDTRFDPERSVIIARTPLEVESNTPAPPLAGKVQWVAKGINDLQLMVEAAGQSVLVVSQIYYPGWKAYLDGKPAAIFPADYALLGVHIPPGSHDVRLSFEPFSFTAGLFLSCSALAVIIALLVRSRMQGNTILRSNGVKKTPRI